MNCTKPETLQWTQDVRKDTNCVRVKMVTDDFEVAALNPKLESRNPEASNLLLSGTHPDAGVHSRRRQEGSPTLSLSRSLFVLFCGKASLDKAEHIQAALERFLPEQEPREAFAKLFQAGSTLLRFRAGLRRYMQVYTSDGEAAELLAAKLAAVQCSASVP